MDEFINPTGVEWRGDGYGVVNYGGGDDKMIVFFFNKAVHNPGKSNEQGRPIYEDVVYVRIHPPGERLNIFEAPATQEHKRRFPVQWHQFQQNKQQSPEGTPIDLLYPDHPAIGAQLRANNVYTIEQCAELSGNAIDNIGMGAQTYCNDAKRYLEIANKGVSASQMRKELDQRDAEIRVLKQQMGMLQETIQKLTQQNQMGAQNMQSFQQRVAGMMERPVHVGQGVDFQSEQINSVRAEQVQAPRRRKPGA